MATQNQFVADGYDRAYAALEPAIQAKIRAEYASRIKNASFLRRLILKIKLHREIRTRIHTQAPPDALY
jgi:hypothetical protein